MISRSAGSEKQLAPESSNLRHLTSVRLAKAKATCFDTLAIPRLEAKLPLVACQLFQATIPLLKFEDSFDI